ncbi:MAG: hypothetical protein HC802_12570 [Caldilineaceae bacterium]|nr:hypothetical protein [Caldilineaceae bacterium]
MTTLHSTTTPISDADSFARNVLRANAIFSVVSGLLLLLGATQVVEWLGLAGDSAVLILRTMGAGLLFFAAYVGWVASRRPINRTALKLIAALDALWILLSALLLVSGALGLTSTGNWIVFLVADMVLVLALLEFYALRKLTRRQAE